MASKERLTCIELACEGERLCKKGDYQLGVEYFEEAVNQGTDNLGTLSAIYSQLGNAYTYLGQFAKGVQYHQHDRTLARTLNDQPGEAKASSNLSNTLKLMGKYDDAIVCSQRHLDIAREMSNKTGEARALYSMANIYHLKAKQKCTATAEDETQDPDVVSDLEAAIKFYQQNLAIVREAGDRIAEGKACGSLGNTYYLLGNCIEAIAFHTERLAIAKEFGDKGAQRRAYTNLGNCHIVLGEFKKAAEHYLQTLSISRQLGDRAFEAQACYSLGSTYTLLLDFKRAIEYHLRHMQLALELGDRVGVGRACWLLSNAHKSLGNYKKAMEYSQQQLQLSYENNDTSGQATAENNLKELAAILGENGQETPRVRRISMEHMKLLSLTPEQKAAADAAKKHRKASADFPRSLLNGDLDARNGNGLPGVVDQQPSVNGHSSRLHDNGSVSRSPGSGGLPNSGEFFDLISRLQGCRMDDQRAEMREDEANGLPEFLRLGENNPRVNDPVPVNGVNDLRPEANRQEQEENHQKMDAMISMLARSQSKRLDEQRVSLSSLPGVRISESNSLPSSPAANIVEPPANLADQRNNNEPAENHNIHLDDAFFDNLIRWQGTRLNDQRSAAPSLEDYPHPTIPDEDFFSLIVRMQSSRIEDQRCRFDPDNP